MPPTGAEGSVWHRYVITYKGRKTVQGTRYGNFTVVTKYVKIIVAKMNDRHYRHLSESSRTKLGLVSMKKAGKPSMGFWHVY